MRMDNQPRVCATTQAIEHPGKRLLLNQTIERSTKRVTYQPNVCATSSASDWPPECVSNQLAVWK